MSSYRSPYGRSGLSRHVQPLPLPQAMTLEELTAIAEEGGPRLDRWRDRVAGLLDRDRLGSAGATGEAALLSVALGQLPHLAHMLIAGGYGGLEPTVLQLVIQFPSQFVIYKLGYRAADYRKAFAERKRLAQEKLVQTAVSGTPELSDIDATAADPLSRWIALHRQAVAQGAAPAEAVKRANKAVYGHESGPQAQQAERPSAGR